MADFNSIDFDDLLKKYEEPQNGIRYNNPKFNEIDYNRAFRGFDQSNEEAHRRQEETKRRIDEEARRHAEEQDRRRMLEREWIERQRPQRPEPVFDYDEVLNSFKQAFGNHSEKSRLLENLVVKFCFFQQRIMSMQTNFAIGCPNNASEKLRLYASNISVPALLEKVFQAIVKEAELNKISKKEISEAIKTMLAMTSESEINNKFVSHFLGAVALKVFKANPNVIKDRKEPFEKSKSRKSVSEGVYLDEDDLDEFDNFDMERIRRMVKDMTDRERRERAIVEENAWGRRGQGRRGNFGEINFLDYASLLAPPSSQSTSSILREELKRLKDLI